MLADPATSSSRSRRRSWASTSTSRATSRRSSRWPTSCSRSAAGGPTDQLWAARAVRALPSSNGAPDGPDGPRLHGRRDSAERLAQAVHYHYDLDPEFYGLFLDPRLVYTCAYFSSPDEDLATAQERKLDYVCRKLRLQPGERLFDIGCGWGALVMHAAQEYGVEAHGVTLSPRQAEVANERIRAARAHRPLPRRGAGLPRGGRRVRQGLEHRHVRAPEREGARRVLRARVLRAPSRRRLSQPRNRRELRQGSRGEAARSS